MDFVSELKKDSMFSRKICFKIETIIFIYLLTFLRLIIATLTIHFNLIIIYQLFIFEPLNIVSSLIFSVSSSSILPLTIMRNEVMHSSFYKHFLIGHHYRQSGLFNPVRNSTFVFTIFCVSFILYINIYKVSSLFFVFRDVYVSIVQRTISYT